MPGGADWAAEKKHAPQEFKSGIEVEKRWVSGRRSVGYLRLSVAANREQVEMGIERLARFAEEFV